MSIGKQIITCYFFLFYLGPMVGNLFFSKDIVSSYQLAPVTPHAIIIIAATYCLFYLLSKSRVPLLPKIRVQWLERALISIGGLYKKFRLAIALIFLPISWMYLQKGMSSYRYSSQGLSQADSPLMLYVVLLYVILTVDMFYAVMLGRVDVSRKLSKRDLENVLISTGLIVAANGTATMATKSQLAITRPFSLRQRSSARHRRDRRRATRSAPIP